MVHWFMSNVGKIHLIFFLKLPHKYMLVISVHKEETCNGEEFNPRCSYDEVIMIIRASYGHINLGRCTPVDFGHFGCMADVTEMASAMCSKKRTCTIDDDAFEDSEPECARGLASYLETTYVCIKGTQTIFISSFVLVSFFLKEYGHPNNFQVLLYHLCVRLSKFLQQNSSSSHCNHYMIIAQMSLLYCKQKRGKKSL